MELESSRIPFIAFFTEYRGHAVEIATAILRKAAGNPVTIVAVGGDGTMHEVVNGAAAYPNAVVAFIPGGSGNDFSRGYNIPKKASQALRQILDQRSLLPMEIDLGKIGHNGDQETYFMNNMGVGFDAAISKEANESRVKTFLNRFSLGRLVYVFILIKNAFTYRRTPVELTVDGKKLDYDSVWFVTVSNQPYYGGGMKIAPAAKPADGLLEVTVVQKLSRWKLLLVFISVFWGKHIAFKEVSQFTAKKIAIDTHAKVLVHADGEVIGHTPLTIDVCPGALTILSGNGTGRRKEELKKDDCH